MEGLAVAAAGVVSKESVVKESGLQIPLGRYSFIQSRKRFFYETGDPDSWLIHQDWMKHQRTLFFLSFFQNC